ncbi:MAG: CRISPR-associated helicase Cas3' [Nitrospira sp.]|nr:CRISPR-associated helicase Cas3' [Nitrospira sp.]
MPDHHHNSEPHSCQYFAHSANGYGSWHPLTDHLGSVAELAGEFMQGHRAFEEARLAGLLHDLGKYGDLFQARLRGEVQGLDHWSQGAWFALQKRKAIAAALAIQGHHIGLQSLSKSELRRLEPKALASNHPLQLRLSEEDLAVLEGRLVEDGLTVPQPTTTALGTSIDSRIDHMLDVRMLFSALVDADFLDTEAHFEGAADGKRYRSPGLLIQSEKALPLLLDHIEKLQHQTQAATVVAEVRHALLEASLNAADHPPGLFSLTAPTGSGKTLAMLAFALKHAQQHGLRRIVVVIPYLSIIEQTASIYRSIFEPIFGEHYVLEHHSLSGRGEEKSAGDNEGEKGELSYAERQRRLLAENWDAPLIVTTSVQMLESLLSNRPSTCRKLHRLARSVILFDEVQTLPANLAVPTLATLSHLAHEYGSTVVFATATQPAFAHLHEAVQSHCVGGWQPREIVPEPIKLFTLLRRTEVRWENPGEGVTWAELSQSLREHAQAMCVVNLKRHAKEVWESMELSAIHLSTSLCPAHRRKVLDTVRERLKHRQQVHLIATQCVEAGVDIDFPVVYRAYAPMDAIIQAAGRCNREGKLAGFGEVRVFLPQDEAYPPGGYQQASQITRMLLRQHGVDGMRLDDPDFVTAYYRRLYDLNKPEAAARTKELLDFIKAGSFPDVARHYRLITQDAINIVVPYGECLDQFSALCDEADRKGLTVDWIHRARLLTVSLYRPKMDDALWDVLIPVKVVGRGDREQNEWFIYAIKEHYHPVLGLVPTGSLNNWIA